MFREVIIKLAGAILLVLGIGLLAFGFVLANKFMQATGFISIMISLVLLYYTWSVTSTRPVEEEPEETMPAAK